MKWEGVLLSLCHWATFFMRTVAKDDGMITLSIAWFSNNNKSLLYGAIHGSGSKRSTQAIHYPFKNVKIYNVCKKKKKKITFTCKKDVRE